LIILAAFAQERQAGLDKTDQSGGSRACTGFIMTNLSGTLDPDDLVEEILDPTMTYSNVNIFRKFVRINLSGYIHVAYIHFCTTLIYNKL